MHVECVSPSRSAKRNRSGVEPCVQPPVGLMHNHLSIISE